MKRNLQTVSELSASSPFTENQLRWWIFHSVTNGLASCLVRISRRVYIDVDLFDKWLGDQTLLATKAAKKE